MAAIWDDLVKSVGGNHLKWEINDTNPMAWDEAYEERRTSMSRGGITQNQIDSISLLGAALHANDNRMTITYELFRDMVKTVGSKGTRFDAMDARVGYLEARLDSMQNDLIQSFNELRHVTTNMMTRITNISTRDTND
ncbi:hypothetical protein FALBO_4571 [Fusarium albosuccineum]|uniref:Uncharacterized protein n=1 Tax=Fusarium albosuccineum TaxID=1237068 RepID=A0A8H4LGC4_9HYPO|nr:hypothetical protein FALBO_4571 [Fusarium albosuccineum]